MRAVELVLLLREAAAATRAASEAAYPGPWVVVECDGAEFGTVPAHSPHVEVRADEGLGWDPACAPLIVDTQDGRDGHRDRCAPHIAQWSPDVALLVAGWLEATADGLSRRGVTARVTPAEASAGEVARRLLPATHGAAT